MSLLSAALEDPDSGDTYFANEVTGETTWDRPESQPEDFHGSYNQNSVSSGHDDKSQNEHSTPSVRFDDSYNQQNEEESESSSEQDDDEYNSSYNPHSLSSDQEGSHKASYHGKANNSDFNFSGQTSVEDDDEGLPDGWYSAIDPDSNERYYCNDETGESQWERPEQEQTSQASSQPDEDHDQSWQDKEDESDVSGELPEGWEAILDPSSGEYYYYNWKNGTTTWDKPVSDNFNRSQQQASIESNSTQSDDGLPENWFAVDDPATGDTYYYNEVTNETSWARPTDTNNLMSRLSVQENNNIVYEEDSVTSSKY